MREIEMLELYKNIGQLDPNFRYWERPDGRGLELVFPDQGFAYPQYLNPDGTFDFERDVAIVQWYCVMRLGALGYARNVYAKNLGDGLRHAVELINVASGKIAYEPVYYPSELHATCRAYFSILIHRDSLEATAS